MEARGFRAGIRGGAIDLGRALAAYAEARSSKGSPRGRRQVGFPLRKKKGHCRDSFRLRNKQGGSGNICIRVGEGHPAR
jgi:hypothetical protein